MVDLVNLYFDQYAKDRCVTFRAMRKDFDRYWGHIYTYKISRIDSECIQLGINKIAAQGHYRTANIAATLIRAVYNWSIKRKLVNVKSMKWQDIDLNSGLWIIPRTKSGTSQTIQLSEAALMILKDRAKMKELNPWVLPGGQYKTNTSHIKQPKIAWEIIKRKAGIKGLRIHDLRRTLASYMVMNNISSATIMTQLGHSSLAAAQTYQRLDLKAAKTATDQAIAVMQQLSKKTASII